MLFRFAGLEVFVFNHIIAVSDLSLNDNVALKFPQMGFQHSVTFVNVMSVVIMNRFGAVYQSMLLYTVADIAAKTPLR